MHGPFHAASMGRSRAGAVTSSADASGCNTSACTALFIKCTQFSHKHTYIYRRLDTHIHFGVRHNASFASTPQSDVRVCMYVCCVQLHRGMLLWVYTRSGCPSVAKHGRCFYESRALRTLRRAQDVYSASDKSAVVILDLFTIRTRDSCDLYTTHLDKR